MFSLSIIKVTDNSTMDNWMIRPSGNTIYFAHLLLLWTLFFKTAIKFLRKGFITL